MRSPGRWQMTWTVAPWISLARRERIRSTHRWMGRARFSRGIGVNSHPGIHWDSDKDEGSGTSRKWDLIPGSVGSMGIPSSVGSAERRSNPPILLQSSPSSLDDNTVKFQNAFIKKIRFYLSGGLRGFSELCLPDVWATFQSRGEYEEAAAARGPVLPAIARLG